jgi:hypothetical protein
MEMKWKGFENGELLALIREAGFEAFGFPYSVICRHVSPDIRVLVVRHQNRDPDYGEKRS